MQTFLPYPDFEMSAAYLDNKRLGKQRVECKQILKALLTGPYQCRQYGTADWVSCSQEFYEDANKHHAVRKTPWYNHPAVQMWKGYEPALADYAGKVCEEWQRRGFKDSLLQEFDDFSMKFERRPKPPWLGNKAFHLSHKSNLFRKNPRWYCGVWSDIPNDLPYIWPTKDLLK